MKHVISGIEYPGPYQAAVAVGRIVDNYAAIRVTHNLLLRKEGDEVTDEAIINSAMVAANTDSEAEGLKMVWYIQSILNGGK
jgi:hypothetical protein